MAKKRKPLPLLLGQMVLVLIGILLFGAYLKSRVTVGIDDQQVHCLPYTFYLIDKHDKTVPVGGYVAFRLDKRGEPFFKEGSLFIKQVKAAQGDVVEVRDGEVAVNDRQVATLHPPILKKTGKTLKEYNRKVVLAQNDLWAMGTTENSYDSRYWGAIDQSMVVGQVYPIH